LDKNAMHVPKRAEKRKTRIADNQHSMIEGITRKGKTKAQLTE